jgi:hypothetical protein
MKQVGAVLLEGQLINSGQLNRALAEQQQRGGKLLKILMDNEAISHESLYNFLASRGLPTINPMNYAVDDRALNGVPRDFAEEYELLPIDRMGPLLTVAMGYPYDQRAIGWLEKLTRLRVKPMLSNFTILNLAIEEHYVVRRGAKFTVDLQYVSTHDAWRSGAVN